MPEISRFLGIVIRMYYRDHAPAHFHAEYGEHEITVDIATGLVNGRFPRRALSAVLDWYKCIRMNWPRTGSWFSRNFLCAPSNPWNKIMLHVTRAEYLGGYRVRVEFNDGYSGVVDLTGRLTGPIFQSLNDLQEFRQISVGGHTLCWKNGADFAPEYLRGLASGRVDEPWRAPEPAPGTVSDAPSSPPAR